MQKKKAPTPTLKIKPPARTEKSGKKDEVKVYGVHACQALFRTRPQDIIRAYIGPNTQKTFGELMKWCAQKKKAYHLVNDVELEKITSSVHHEGIALLCLKKTRLSSKEALLRLSQSHTQTPETILFLDGVGNPHNLGAILRTSAALGVRMIFGLEGSLPEISPSAGRIAEGAVEHVDLVTVEHSNEVFQKLKQIGFKLLSTECHEGQSIFGVKIPPKVCFVMGAEILGVSKSLSRLCDLKVTIPSTKKVESLNVSVATGIFLGEAYRQHLHGKSAH